MKLGSRARPAITITVTGKTTRRMLLGVAIMRLGARLIHAGGVKLTYT